MYGVVEKGQDEVPQLAWQCLHLAQLVFLLIFLFFFYFLEIAFTVRKIHFNVQKIPIRKRKTQRCAAAGSAML
jgi:hypothetical protein